MMDDDEDDDDDNNNNDDDDDDDRWWAAKSSSRISLAFVLVTISVAANVDVSISTFSTPTHSNVTDSKRNGLQT